MANEVQVKDLVPVRSRAVGSDHGRCDDGLRRLFPA